MRVFVKPVYANTTYVFEIDGVGKHILIAVKYDNNKLYAHFVNA